jgi:transcriptional regulator GlxA family with amidase domain
MGPTRAFSNAKLHGSEAPSQLATEGAAGVGVSPSRRFEVESYDPLILGAITFIESNIHRSLTVQDIAAHAGLCVSEFARRFRGSVGRSPKQIIISIRMRRAAMLLCDTELSPKEIGSGHLAACFERCTAYRRPRIGCNGGLNEARSRYGDYLV